MGVGLASYTADYSGYLPCFPGWGWTGYGKIGVSTTDVATGRTGDLPIGAGYFSTCLRTIGSGEKDNLDSALVYPLVGGYPAMTNGMFNQAPVGIGYLLSSGYIDDARVYYCPSSEGMPGSFAGNTFTAPSGVWLVSQWKTAGGTQAQNLCYGNFNNLARSKSYTAGGPGKHRKTSTESGYAYRNVPVVIDGVVTPEAKNYLLSGTRPTVSFRTKSPMFATDRILAGRAIAMDAFDKGDGAGSDALGVNNNTTTRAKSTNIEETRRMAGMGIKGHRDGYNLLYGEGNVSWFGDPRQSIIWHTQGEFAASAVRGSEVRNLLARNHFNKTTFDSGAGANTAHFAHTNLAIWHEMDTSAGIDVGADMLVP